MISAMILSRILIKVRELEEFLVFCTKTAGAYRLRTNQRTSGYCMQRLILLPGERESCVGRQNRLENEGSCTAG